MPRGRRGHADVYHRGTFQKRVDLRDKAARRLLAVELMQHSVNQTRLAEALGLSRQTLHNYRESFREFGVQGLLHGYSPSRSKSEELQRHLHVDKRRPGTKARELEALRRAKRARERGAEQGALTWDDAPALHLLEEPAIEDTLGAALASAPEPTPAAQLTERPFARAHDWQASRYAGVFPILLVLFSQWRWLQRLLLLFGDGWRLFMVFALMAVRNIRSLEQLKHVRHEELGWVLGLRMPASVDTLWGWFHDVAKTGRSGVLLEGFFADQLRRGPVATQF